MALRKPLVINAGNWQQLQSGDTLDAPQSGGDDQVLTNGNAGACVIGTPVYCSANDTFDKAKADASGTKEVIGLVSQAPNIANAASGPVRTSGTLTATTAQWDAVTAQTGGLVKDQVYWLDPATAGKLTITAPTTIGQYLVEVGKGLSTTEMLVRVRVPVLL